MFLPPELTAMYGMANETQEPLVTLIPSFKTFSYICVTVRWPYSTSKLHTVTIMMHVSFLPPDCVTRVSGQDSQQERTCGLTETSQHENSTVNTKIKIASWVTKYTIQINFQELCPACSTYLTYLFWHIFHELTSLEDLGLLIYEAP
jgi:hypothetical protein